MAVVHGPQESGYRGGSEAMVNIRCTLAQGGRGGRHQRRVRGVRWSKAAKALFFPDRALPAAAHAGTRGRPARARAGRARNAGCPGAASIRSGSTLSRCWQEMRAFGAAGPPPGRPDFTLERTTYWDTRGGRLPRRRRTRRGAVGGAAAQRRRMRAPRRGRVCANGTSRTSPERLCRWIWWAGYARRATPIRASSTATSSPQYLRHDAGGVAVSAVFGQYLPAVVGWTLAAPDSACTHRRRSRLTRWRPEVVRVSAATPVRCVPGLPTNACTWRTPSHKERPYEPPDLPPYRGPMQPARAPRTPSGHFDHLEPGTRAFMAAHMYGTIRFVLDVWERYLGARDPLALRGRPRSARAGPGRRVGQRAMRLRLHRERTSPQRREMRRTRSASTSTCSPHELGHAFIYSLLGLPPLDRVSTEYLAFHESAADCAAMIAVLHFDSVVDAPAAHLARQHLPPERAQPHRRAVRHRATPHRQQLAHDERRAGPAHTGGAAHPAGPPCHRPAADRARSSTSWSRFSSQFLVDERFISRDLDELARHGGERVCRRGVSGGVRPRLRRAGTTRSRRRCSTRATTSGDLLADTWRLLGWDVTFEAVAVAMLAADARLTSGMGRQSPASRTWRGGVSGPDFAESGVYRERLATPRDQRW